MYCAVDGKSERKVKVPCGVANAYWYFVCGFAVRREYAWVKEYWYWHRRYLYWQCCYYSQMGAVVGQGEPRQNLQSDRCANLFSEEAPMTL